MLINIRILMFFIVSFFFRQVKSISVRSSLAFDPKMLGLKPSNKVQAISSVSLAGLPTDTLIQQSSGKSGKVRRHSKGSLSGSLQGFEHLEVLSCVKFNQIENAYHYRSTRH